MDPVAGLGSVAAADWPRLPLFGADAGTVVGVTPATGGARLLGRVQVLMVRVECG